MKTIPRFLMVLAAGALLTGVAQAQDKTAVHQGMSTNAPANARFSLTLSPAPTLPFGPDAQATGLLVDLLQPDQTIDLFNPWVSPFGVPPPPVTLAQPVAQHMDDNLADHDAGFVFLRLSFR